MAASHGVIAHLHCFQQAFNDALHIIEVNVAFIIAPVESFAAAAQYSGQQLTLLGILGQRQCFRQENTADFKQSNTVVVVAQVEGSSLQCARNHGGAHYGESVGNRVQQLDAAAACIICCQQHFIISVSLDEAIGHHFAQACANHVILYIVLNIVQHRLAALGDGQLRLMAFDEVVAMHTGNFLADISIAVDITAPGRSGNQQLAVLCFYAEAQFGEDSNHFVLSDIYADAAVNLGCGSGDYCRLQLFRISLYDTAEGFAGTHCFQ